MAQPLLAVDLARLADHARKLLSEGQLESAVEMLEAALQEYPREPELCYRLASARVRQGRLSEARELLERGLEERYEDARFHTNLGVVADMEGDREGAIRAFRRAMQLAPQDPTAPLNLGALYGEVGRYDDAARVLGRAVELRGDYDAVFNLGLVRYKQGEIAEAEHWFASAARKREAGGLVHYYQGRCKLRRGLTAAAIGHFQQALKLEPELAVARLHLGMALNQNNHYREAVAELDKAAKALADDGRVHYQLGIAYDGLCMKQEARDSYRRARTLSS